MLQINRTDLQKKGDRKMRNHPLPHPTATPLKKEKYNAEDRENMKKDLIDYNGSGLLNFWRINF
jgi:hypothetical protein